MAHRDRGQGFGFMYVNIAKVLEERKNESPTTQAPVLTNNVRHANFNIDKSSATTKSDGKEAAIVQVKENLDRLQSLHHKLHAMLDELNKISTNQSKRNKT